MCAAQDNYNVVELHEYRFHIFGDFTREKNKKSVFKDLRKISKKHDKIEVYISRPEPIDYL
jgi:hypothetical protein